MENSIRWSVIVSKETDVSLRTYLAQKGKRKGDLSKFVEEAVRWRVLDQTVSEVKKLNVNVPEKELASAIEDAVRSVRAESFKTDAA